MTVEFGGLAAVGGADDADLDSRRPARSSRSPVAAPVPVIASGRRSSRVDFAGLVPDRSISAAAADA